MTSHESPILTVKEAAAYARCCDRLIYRALRRRELKGSQGVGPVQTPRGTWRIHRDDLDAWLRGENPEQHTTKLKRVTREPRRLRGRS